jgi:hypothetical protein
MKKVSGFEKRWYVFWCYRGCLSIIFVSVCFGGALCLVLPQFWNVRFALKWLEFRNEGNKSINQTVCENNYSFMRHTTEIKQGDEHIKQGEAFTLRSGVGAGEQPPRRRDLQPPPPRHPHGREEEDSTPRPPPATGSTPYAPSGAVAPMNPVPTRAATIRAPATSTTTQRRWGRAREGHGGQGAAEQHQWGRPLETACLHTCSQGFHAQIPAAPITGVVGLRRQPPQGTAREGGARWGGGGGGVRVLPLPSP